MRAYEGSCYRKAFFRTVGETLNLSSFRYYLLSCENTMNAQSPCTRVFMIPHAHSLLSKLQTLIIAKWVIASLDDSPVHQSLGHASQLLREDLAVSDNADV